MRNLSLEAGALWAFIQLGWTRAAAERATLIGRLLLYLLILAIFWQLWLATPLQELTDAPLGAADLLWYVAITEWIIFAAGSPYRSVEEQIRGGGIESALTRPMPYALATLAEWIGATAFYLLAIGAAGLAAAWGLTGTLPLTPAAAVPLLVAGLLGSIILLLFQLQLGYATAWLGTAAPMFWIWQKLMFVFGGLLLPLTLYPSTLRAIAENGPFAAILFAPGSFALLPPAAPVVPILLQQCAWLVAVAAATVLVDRAAAARLTGRGA